MRLWLPAVPVVVLVLATWSGGGCTGDPLQAVNSPGGAFRSGAGCSVPDLDVGGAQACPTSPGTRAQLGFDDPADATAVDAGANLTDKRVTCRRSWCGPGSLAVHASYRWPTSGPIEGEKLGELRYRFDQPTDVYGKTITHALFADGPNTPLNAFIAVIDPSSRFWMVQDLPVNLFGQWIQRGARVDGDNARLALPPGTTSLVVSEIRIAVYLATDVRTGDRDHWAADVYVDELAWR